MDLVEDDVVDPLQPLRILIDKVRRISCHYDHRRRRVDRVFAGHQADVALTRGAVGSRGISGLIEP